MGRKCVECGKITTERYCPDCNAIAKDIAIQTIADAHSRLERYLWALAYQLDIGEGLPFKTVQRAWWIWFKVAEEHIPFCMLSSEDLEFVFELIKKEFPDDGVEVFNTTMLFDGMNPEDLNTESKIY